LAKIWKKTSREDYLNERGSLIAGNQLNCTLLYTSELYNWTLPTQKPVSERGRERNVDVIL
jgi:hypothetical protein